MHDVAHLLGFKPKALAYILYKKPSAEKYTQFEIAKRNGGSRIICAPYPELMNLQRRLSDLLQTCTAEINAVRRIDSVLSHGFRRKHSIMTNAAVHRARRYVLNIDLENFFGTINFGRVRGFFLTNRDYGLHPKVATILAQIACHENALPQGSPCSPVISNLIGHLLDIRLAALAYNTGCAYSRYADDITFSTNKKVFPERLAVPVDGKPHQWRLGEPLLRDIANSGFSINNEKTRLQYKESRQEVTGLVVNKKVNVRSDYRHIVRAMVHRLVKSGRFQRAVTGPSEPGKATGSVLDGTIDQLNGMLGFIESVRVFNLKRHMRPSERERPLKPSSAPGGGEQTYRRFLFYKHFFAGSFPLIVCEGKTDIIYIQSAIRRLAREFPELAEVDVKGIVRRKVSLFRRTPTTDRILGLSGGTGQLVGLIKDYVANRAQVAVTANTQPVILLIDNDDGAKGIYKYIGNLTKLPPSPSASFLTACPGLYVVATPLTATGGETMIEDFFEDAVRKTVLNGKTFNPKNEDLDHKNEYGKAYFATHVIKKGEDSINFDGFRPILSRIEAAIAAHKVKTP